MILVVTSRPLQGPRRTSVELYALNLHQRMLQRPSSVPVILLGPPRPVRSRRAAISLLSRCLARKPSLIQVENRPAWVLLLRRLGYRGPIVLHLHSLTFIRPRRIAPRKLRRALRAADAIVCNSQFLRRHLLRTHPDAFRASTQLVRIYPGVDPTLFRPAKPSRAAEDHRRRQPTILFAGRIVPQKGLHVLLKACAELPRRRRCTLLIAGGPRPRRGAKGYSGRLYRLARRLPISVRFLGSVPHQRMVRLYRRADLLAFPSQGGEAFGLVSVEAMASGLPVIASAVGGVREIIRHGVDGYLVSSYRDPRAWARALTRVLTNVSLRRRLTQNARRRVLRRFTLDTTAAAFQRLYRRLLQAHARRPRTRSVREMGG